MVILLATATFAHYVRGLHEWGTLTRQGAHEKRPPKFDVVSYVFPKATSFSHGASWIVAIFNGGVVPNAG